MDLLQINGLGKEYDYRWVFRDLHLELRPDMVCAISGANGSGKSTLLQIISGFVSPSEGSCELMRDKEAVDPDNYYRQVAIAAPYMELPEELKLAELVRFHLTFRNARTEPGQWIEASGLSRAALQQIKYYSSGMKQRVRLMLAFFSDTPLLLLDEPTSNLDKAGIQWYEEMLAVHRKGRIVCIASNEDKDFHHVAREIKMEEFKTGP